MSEPCPRRVEELFDQAIDLDPARLTTFLDEQCAGDADLRAAVEELLQIDRRAQVTETLLRSPVAGSRLKASAPPAPLPSIARYRLVRVLGEGGMGTVYEAEQDNPRRTVALKVIRPGLVSPALLERFAQEAQILGLLHHPGIASIHEAGLSQDGQPFFVMELVQGTPLTRFCDERKLSPRARLELFAQVCDSVQHAHQKGIVHQDLKPSNILVAECDGKPAVKVIDFGVARAVEQPADGQGPPGGRQVLGTLEYMSPEQATPGQDVDTRSDVYALGVLLYELLTGSTPLDRKRLPGTEIAEVLRLIREGQTPCPSTRLRLADTLPEIAAGRGTIPARLTREVRGELDWAVMKALEKDRDRRYQTASALAEDVRRYLADEPVLAGSPPSTYRLRKFVHRNRAAVAAAVAIVGLLVAGVVGTAVGLVRAVAARRAEAEQRRQAEQQRDRALAAQRARRVSEARAREGERSARRSAAEARAVLGFFQRHVLAAARPGGQGGGLGIDTTIRQAIDAAEPVVSAGFREQPLVEASIRDVLGGTYLYLGEARLALRQHERAREVFRAHRGPEHPDTLSSSNSVGVCCWRLGEYDRAAALFAELLPVVRRVHGLEHPMTLNVLFNLAAQDQARGRYSRATARYEQCLRLQTAWLGRHDPATLDSLDNLAHSYQQIGRPQRAIGMLRECCKVHTARLGADHPTTIQAMNNLGLAYLRVGRVSAAETRLGQCLRLATAKLGPNHPYTLASLHNLGAARLAAGRPAQALPLLERGLRLQRERLGNNHPDTLTGLNNLAQVYLKTGRLHQGLVLLQECHRRMKVKLGRDHPATLTTLNNLGMASLGCGRLTQATALLEQCLRLRTAALGSDHPDTRASLHHLALAYQNAGRAERALQLLERYSVQRQTKLSPTTRRPGPAE
jgi:serine/threonine protein kinase/tetratricopeptide (TPR) repeat protein